MRRVLFAIILAFGFVSPVWADFQKGLDAAKRGDFATALSEWNPLAEKGDARAQYGLGVMYFQGKGVPQDYKTAVKWYTLAAEQGDAPAQYSLGQMYRIGQGVPKNEKTALKWLSLSAEQGLASAQSILGWMYQKGKGVPKNDKTAVKWYELAAKQGFAVAQYNLGHMYRIGQGVPKNEKTALKWYDLAAKQGYADAQHSLGVTYRDGEGVPRDYKIALKWFTLSAEQGFASAQYNLGVMYRNGQGVPKNEKTALKWFSLAAKQGFVAALDQVEAIKASQVLPVVPTLESILGIPARYLAAGYLAVDSTVSMAEMALKAGANVNVTLDGKKVILTQVNAEPYLKAYRKRLEIYRQAIEQRGFAEIAGRYALNANTSCQGQKFGMSEMFAIGERDGKPVISDELVVRQTGFKTDIVMTATIRGESTEIIYPGVAVEDAVIFRAPSNMGFNFWGVIKERVVNLRVDVKEVQNALGAYIASELDWRTMTKCMIALTPQ